MILYLTWATIVFAAALIIVEMADSKNDDLTRKPISHFFKTSSSLVQSSMFVVMAAALFYTAYEQGFSWLSLSFIGVGVGLIFAMATDTWPRLFFGADRILHYAGAATCFIAGLSMMLARGTYAYALAYVLGALLMVAIDPKHTAVQEKIGVLLLVVWVFSFSVGII